MSSKRKKGKPKFVLDCATQNSHKVDYNCLKDPCLAGYFASPRRRLYLLKNKVIKANG